MVTNPPANAGDVGSIPGSERSLEEDATHSSILAWRIPWTDKPGGLRFIGSRPGAFSSDVLFHFVFISQRPRWPVTLRLLASKHLDPCWQLAYNFHVQLW